MGRTRKKNRISSKIDELPSEIKGQVDVMLSDTSNSYQDVSGWLKEKGYEISKSSVGRYAVRSNTAAQRLLEAQSRTEALVNVVRKNPDADYTEEDEDEYVLPEEYEDESYPEDDAEYMPEPEDTKE